MLINWPCAAESHVSVCLVFAPRLTELIKEEEEEK